MFVVAGRINVDTVIELEAKLVLGGKTLAKRVLRVFGGSGLNAAVALKRLSPGSEVALVGCVGSDWEGREVLEFLRREGVSTLFVSILEGSTGRAFVILEPSGESTSITLPGVNASCVAPTHLKEVGDLEGVVVMNPPPEVCKAVLSLARERGAVTVCDFGTETPRLLPVLRELAWEQAVFAPTIHEIGSVEKGLEIARELGIRVVIKAGSSGAIAIDPLEGVKARVPSLDPRELGLEPRSSSGCGDTFTATLAAYLSKGSSLVNAVAHAIVAAAIKASRLEPFEAPTLSELEQAFRAVGQRILEGASIEPLTNR